MFVQSLERIAEAFGFGHFVFQQAPTSSDTLLSPLIVETSMPMHMLKDFDRNNLLKAFRALTPSKESILPTTWHLPNPSSANETMFSEGLKKFLTEKELRIGFAFQVTGLEGHRFLFWFCGIRSPLGQIEINELSMLVLHALATYHTIKRNSAALISTLSAREIEVIRWTAQGKTSVEIAQILALSDHTVNAYMTNAIRKLDCVNRTHLVAKAMRLKLIS